MSAPTESAQRVSSAGAASASSAAAGAAIATPPQNEAARAFAIDAARLLADTRCHQVVVLNVAGVSPVTDYFVIATGTSQRQMKSAADAVEELGDQRDFGRMSRSGDEVGHWILVDAFDVVVHLFNQDSRAFYDFDNLWGDARRIEWERPDQKRPGDENLSSR